MGSGGVAIAALPTVICFKVTFSDGLGGGSYYKGAGPTFLVSSAKKIGKCAMFLRSMSLFHYFCKNLIVCQFPRML